MVWTQKGPVRVWRMKCLFSVEERSDRKPCLTLHVDVGEMLPTEVT